MTRLALPSKFNPQAVPGWIAQLGAFLEEAEIHLVLPKDAFFTPAGTSLLASGIARRQSQGKVTSLQAEDPDCDAFRYLQRIDFFESLGVRTDERFSRLASEGRFVSLQRIEEFKKARNLAEAAAEFLERQLPKAPPSVIRGLRFVLEELGANIVQHSGSAETGFGLAQAYPEADRFELAFCDCGIGFLKSLQKNPEFSGRVANDAEAIQLAAEKGLSGVGGRTNMGMGLPLLRDLSDRLGANLWILSGSALWSRYSAVGSRRVTVVQAVSNFPGSWICLEGPIFPN